MVFYHWGPGRKGADKPRYEGTVALFGKDFERGLERYVRQMDPRKSRLWNTFNSTRSPVKQADFIGQQQFRKLASFCWQDPRNVLAEMERSFETTVQYGDHFGKVMIPSGVFDSMRGFCGSWDGAGEMIISLPVRENQNDHRSPITGWQDTVLLQSPIGWLRNQRIVVDIGGPKQSGKSTLAATMARAANNAIRTIQSQKDWNDFHLEATYVNMDLATPTVEAIARPGRIDSEELRRIKRPWTPELALEAVMRLRGAMRPGLIIFADLPGKLTEITEILATPGDVSVLITHDWRRMHGWLAFMNRLGKDPAGIIRSRLRSNDYDSAVTRYLPGRSAAGRITLLSRSIKPENEFVRPFTLIMLLDLLPTLIQKRKKALELLIPDSSMGGTYRP